MLRAVAGVVLGYLAMAVLVFTLLGIFGLLARAWYDFNTKMDEMEAQRLTPRQPRVDEHS